MLNIPSSTFWNGKYVRNDSLSTAYFCLLRWFSLNGSASGRSNGGTKFRPANAVRIGANDARHREHLMAPARQLTSSATLKGNGCREIRLLEVRRLVARSGLVESN